jgi:hypothetical protein
MNPESYRPFDRRGRELGARRSPPARFISLPTRRELLQQQKPKQTPLTQISLQSPVFMNRRSASSQGPYGMALREPWVGSPGGFGGPNLLAISRLESLRIAPG